MASTLNFIQAIQQKDFPAAKDMFLTIVRDRMESVLQREYQTAAKSYLKTETPKQ